MDREGALPESVNIPSSRTGVPSMLEPFDGPISVSTGVVVECMAALYGRNETAIWDRCRFLVSRHCWARVGWEEFAGGPTGVVCFAIPNPTSNFVSLLTIDVFEDRCVPSIRIWR